MYAVSAPATTKILLYQARGISKYFFITHLEILDTYYIQRTARVWRDFKSLYVLDGHEEAVWAVLIIEPTKYLTGSFYLWLIYYFAKPPS